MRKFEWIKYCVYPIVIVVGSLLIAIGWSYGITKLVQHICDEAIVNFEHQPETIKTKISILTITHNNHQYLVFQQNNIIDDNQLEIIHDPDCPCYTKETNP